MSIYDKSFHFDLDVRQYSYLVTIVEADLKKCSCCSNRNCGLTKEQCESFKKVKNEVNDILKSL